MSNGPGEYGFGDLINSGDRDLVWDDLGGHGAGYGGVSGDGEDKKSHEKPPDEEESKKFRFKIGHNSYGYGIFWMIGAALLAGIIFAILHR